MDLAIEHVRSLAEKGGFDRRQAMVALQNIAFSLEDLHDTIHRYGHMVRPVSWLSMESSSNSL